MNYALAYDVTLTLYKLAGLAFLFFGIIALYNSLTSINNVQNSASHLTSFHSALTSSLLFIIAGVLIISFNPVYL